MGCDAVIAKTQSGSPPPLSGEGRGGGAENHSRKTEQLHSYPYLITGCSLRYHELMGREGALGDPFIVLLLTADRSTPIYPHIEVSERIFCMPDFGTSRSHFDLTKQGIESHGNIFWNLRAASLVEHAIRRNEGVLANNGALGAKTAPYTGRSPKDKFVVRDKVSESLVAWCGVNQPITPEHFENLYQRVLQHYRDRDLFVQDCFIGAHPDYRLPVRVITEYAWQSLFVRNLLVRATEEETRAHIPEFTVLGAPKLLADPNTEGTRSTAAIVLNFSRKLILVVGTGYAGEIKKSLFTLFNYLLPQRGILPMHCSANLGKAGDVAIFFGLSGTGKTTLSADPTRSLIGDDEHGWTNDGIFNFEGGCYAKCIRLSKKYEPQIWDAIRFGSVLENVVIDPETGEVDYNSSEITENTRAAYPVDYIPNAVIPGIAGHPKNVIFLTADAFGVLPPISRLTPEQAMYHYLSGYTSKIAGTEAGMGSEPEATFSTCFGAPFLPMEPTVYAELLGKKLAQHKATAWLINTGWSGGPFGVGERINIAHTRAMTAAVLEGALNSVTFHQEPAFGFYIPTTCPGVPAEVLDPRRTWSNSADYDVKAAELSKHFKANFKKFATAMPELEKATPQPASS